MFKKILIAIVLILTHISYGYTQNNDCDRYLKEYNSLVNRLTYYYKTNNMNPKEFDGDKFEKEVDLVLGKMESCYGDPDYVKKAQAIYFRFKKVYDDYERRKRISSSQTTSKVNTNSNSKPRYGEIGTLPQGLSYNAWQCGNCGQLSRGNKQPNFWGCPPNNSSHFWLEATTQAGFQCKDCGIECYIGRAIKRGTPDYTDFQVKCRKDGKLHDSYDWVKF